MTQCCCYWRLSAWSAGELEVSRWPPLVAPHECYGFLAQRAAEYLTDALHLDWTCGAAGWRVC